MLGPWFGGSPLHERQRVNSRAICDHSPQEAHIGALTQWDEWYELWHSATRSATRSKSIAVDFDLPFGTVSMDGKYVSVPSVDDQYAQRSSLSDTGTVTGRIGTMSASLCSSEARPCIDVYLIPAQTNEMGVLPRALDALLEAYGHLDPFRLVAYDAGACSKVNAEHIRVRNLHYHLGLKGAQPQLLYWARLSFKDRYADAPDARTVDGKHLAQVTRSILLLPCPDGTEDWPHLRTIIRVDSVGFDQPGCPTQETRYFCSWPGRPKVLAFANRPVR